MRAASVGRIAAKSSCKCSGKSAKNAAFPGRGSHEDDKEEIEKDSKVAAIVASLKACSKKKDLLRGCQVHARIADGGLLEKHTYVRSAVISMYAKCGALGKAQQILDRLTTRDVVSWTALIAGYVEQRQGHHALCCYHRMCSEGVLPDAITYTCILKACGITQDIHSGTKIHDEIVSKGLLKNSVVLGTALVDMFTKCGEVMKAQEVFDELPERNVATWSALIAGYAQHGKGQEALGCYRRMCSEGLSPNAITYVSVLKACGIMHDIDMGNKIHDDIVSQGLLKRNVILGNALIDMYVKCGLLTKAQRTLDQFSVRNVVTWSTLIAGYVQQGQGLEALGCFQKMCKEGLSPNAITYLCILKACALTQDVDMGNKLHNEIVSQGLLEKDPRLGTALINMYSKSGALLKAQRVLDKLPVRSVSSWGALITGYAQQGRGKEALDCFQRMCSEGLCPDEMMFACISKACGIVQDVDMANKIYDKIVSQGLLGKNIVLGTALVDMYAKCGILTKAQKLFDTLPIRNVVSWSALISGYAQHGHGKEALGCFCQMCTEGLSPDVAAWNALIGGYAQQGLAQEALDCFQWMEQEGTAPNAITFANVLNACSHSGSVDEGQKYFDTMTEQYGIMPDEEHCTSMVDLYARARLFDKALGVIKSTPSCASYLPVWSALLGACQKWGNVKIGRYAFEHAIQLDRWGAASYVVMKNIYAAAGMHDEAYSIYCLSTKNAVRSSMNVYPGFMPVGKFVKSYSYTNQANHCKITRSQS